MAIQLSSNFLVSAQLPLDERQIALTLVVRDAIPNIQRFEGLFVYVLSTEKTYQLQGGVTNSDWVEIGGAGAGWGLTGNAGTDPTINFLGTTDNQDVVIRRNNLQVGRFYNNSRSFGLNAGNANQTNFFGSSAGENATNADGSNFFGADAGKNSTNGSNSNFFGLSAGFDAPNAFNSNFFGESAGQDAINANSSNFFGLFAGINATGANNSNFFGVGAGQEATNASNSNLFGFSAGKTFTGNNLGSNNIIIGTNISLPNLRADSLNIGGLIFGTNTYADTLGDPSILASTEGRVGIRTVTPLNTLHITSDSANTSGLRFQNLTSVSPTVAGEAIGVDSNGDVVRIVGGGWTLLGNAGTNPTTNFIGTTDNQRLVIRTNNVEQMTVLPNGNVGIGTSTPVTSLHVIAPAQASTAESIIRIGVADAPDNFLRIANASSVNGAFLPFIEGTNAVDGRQSIFFSSNGLETPFAGGLYPALAFGGRTTTNTMLTTKPIVTFQNLATSTLTNWYDGRTKIGGTDVMSTSGSGALRPTTMLDVIGNGSSDDLGNFIDGTTSRLFINRDGRIGLGTITPASTSLLDLTSTTRGFLSPRMTTVERDAIVSPATGLQIYNLTTESLNIYNGTIWIDLGSAGSNYIVLAPSTLNIRSLDAGDGTTANQFNAFIGQNAGLDNTDGQGNFGLGRNSLRRITGARFNTAIGEDTLSLVNIGGNGTGSFQNSNSYNTAIGYKALENFSGQTNNANPRVSNTAIGAFAGRDITNGRGNTLIGTEAGSGTTNGNFNVIIGAGGNGNADNRVIIGAVTGNTVGTGGVLIGLIATNQGSDTVGIGRGNQGTGSFGIYIGRDAGRANTGTRNIMIGMNTGAAFNAGNFGNNNLFIGHETLNGTNNARNTNRNTFLGILNSEYVQGTSNDNVSIGYFVRPLANTGSNQMTIGSSDRPFILKATTNNYLVNAEALVTGSITIKPTALFEINGTKGGFLPPQLTTVQRDAIASPVAGLIIYNTTDNKHQGYDGTIWNDFY